MYGYDFEFGRGSPGWRAWAAYDEEMRGGSGRAMGWTGGAGYGGRAPGRRSGGGGDYARGRGVYGEDYPTFGGYPGGQGGIHYGGRTPGGFSGGGLQGGGRGFGGPGGMGSGYDRGYGRGGTGGFSGGYTGGGSSGRYSERGLGMGRTMGGGEYGGGYTSGFGTRTGAYGTGGHAGGAGYGGRFGGEGAGRGFGRGFEPGGATGEPFLPEDAYRLHPELDRPPNAHRGGRWPEGSGTMDLEDFDDSDIEGAVRETLHQDRWLTTSEIEVEVADGVVTLRGEVSDYMEARYAWDDAWETDGVRGVINQLTVRTDQAAPEHGDKMPQSTGTKKGRKGSGNA